MKLLVVLGIIAVMASIAMTKHANWGKQSPGDKRLLSGNLTLPAKIGKERIRYVTYGPRVNKYVITAIIIRDNFKNNSGAIADIENGGVGQSFAVIRLQTNKSQGMNSSVAVFGKLSNRPKGKKSSPAKIGKLAKKAVGGIVPAAVHGLSNTRANGFNSTRAINNTSKRINSTVPINRMNKPRAKSFNATASAKRQKRGG